MCVFVFWSLFFFFGGGRGKSNERKSDLKKLGLEKDKQQTKK